MTPRSIRFNLLPKALITLQFIIIALTYVHSRTPLVWIWAISSFIPVTIVSLMNDEKKYVLSSLILLFISQHSIFLFVHQTWGYSFGSDSINDLHIASVISERSNFLWGETGYTQRPGYSYYPLLHLFSVALSKVCGLYLGSIALYVIPIFNASFVAILLFYLNQEFFGLHSRERNLATLFFATGWYYTLYGANFTREVFAFPFVLLTLLIFAKAIRQQRREYLTVLYILFIVVILSHQVSSYLLLIVLLVMAIGYRLSHRDIRMIYTLLSSYSVMLLSFTSFVALDFTVRQGTHAITALGTLFRKETPAISPVLMGTHEHWKVELALISYSIIGLLSLVGALRLLREKQKNRESMPLILFFAFAFIVSMMLRASISADPWSWTYYMSLRGTIWAFLGISALLTIGFRYVLKSNINVNWKGIFLLFVVCVLAAGKFSQNPLLISDPSVTPGVTSLRYKASLWLRAEAPHGSNFLVAPHSSDVQAFDASRSMAPYAYLSEYFLDNKPYSKFNGYIPIIGGYFDRYQDLPDVNILYSNGEAQIGFNAR